MKLKDILAISGKGGLFQFVSQGRNGIIVESFEDKKRTVVHSSAKVSALEDIAIFTENEEVPLADVFKKLYEKENGKETISHKSSPEELKALLQEILPEYDRERVYVSDIKKLVHWYNVLIQHNMLKPEEEEPGEDKKEIMKEDKVTKAETKPAAKPGQKKKPAQTKTTSPKQVQKPASQRPKQVQKKDNPK
jgi:hypothetical protein